MISKIFRNGRKIDAARNSSKSFEKYIWRFLTFFALREKCRKVSKKRFRQQFSESLMELVGHGKPHKKGVSFQPIRKLEKAVAVSGVCSGVLEENSRKVLGKLLEQFFPNPEMLLILGIRALGKKPTGNLGSTLPGRCPHLPCGVFVEIDSSSLLEFFWTHILGAFCWGDAPRSPEDCTTVQTAKIT